MITQHNKKFPCAFKKSNMIIEYRDLNLTLDSYFRIFLLVKIHFVPEYVPILLNVVRYILANFDGNFTPQIFYQADTKATEQ